MCSRTSPCSLIACTNSVLLIDLASSTAFKKLYTERTSWLTPGVAAASKPLITYFTINCVAGLVGFTWHKRNTSRCDHPFLCLYLVTATARARGFFSVYHLWIAFLCARPQPVDFGLLSFSQNSVNEKRCVGIRRTCVTASYAARFVSKWLERAHIAKAKMIGSCLAVRPSVLYSTIIFTASGPRPSVIILSKAWAFSCPSFCSVA